MIKRDFVELCDRIISTSMTGGCALFAIKLYELKNWEVVGYIDCEGNIVHFASLATWGIIDGMGAGCNLLWVDSAYEHCGDLKQFTSNGYNCAVGYWHDVKDDIYDGYEQDLDLFLASELWNYYQFINSRN